MDYAKISARLDRDIRTTLSLNEWLGREMDRRSLRWRDQTLHCGMSSLSGALKLMIARSGNPGAVFQNCPPRIPTSPKLSRYTSKAAPCSPLSTNSRPGSQTIPSLRRLLTTLRTAKRHGFFAHPNSRAAPPSAPPSAPPPHLPQQQQQQHPKPKPPQSRPGTLIPPTQAQAPPQTLTPAPIPRPTELPYSTLKKDPKFKALSRKWTSLIVAFPIALFTSWVLWGRSEFPPPPPPKRCLTSRLPLFLPPLLLLACSVLVSSLREQYLFFFFFVCYVHPPASSPNVTRQANQPPGPPSPPPPGGAALHKQYRKPKNSETNNLRGGNKLGF